MAQHNQQSDSQQADQDLPKSPYENWSSLLANPKVSASIYGPDLSMLTPSTSTENSAGLKPSYSVFTLLALLRARWLIFWIEPMLSRMKFVTRSRKHDDPDYSGSM